MKVNNVKIKNMKKGVGEKITIDELALMVGNGFKEMKEGFKDVRNEIMVLRNEVKQDISRLGEKVDKIYKYAPVLNTIPDEEDASH